jgi:formate hydrogenlyase transcriptional activator
VSSNEHDRLQAERDRLALLLEVTNLLVSRRDLVDLLSGLSDCLGRTVPHDHVSVALLDGSLTSGTVRLFLQDGTRRPEFEQRPVFISEPSRLQFTAGEPVLYDVEWLAEHNPPTAAAIRPLGIVSFCSVPLTTARGPLGIINVGSRRRDAFDRDDVSVLQQVSGQVAIAIANCLAYEEIQRLTERVLSEKHYLEDEIRASYDFADIVGRSAAMRRTLHEVETVASTGAAVLLLGETGTGKERVARAIHDRSPRHRRNFVQVNCAAIPVTLVESELFGHERGAFTGATATRVGRFEVADGGTIFLDEVGDLPLDVQPKLLRVLQEQEFERLGGKGTRRVDVRVIAATNRDLAQMVIDGTFREDLFYRLNVFPIRLPPLRERQEDIPVLIRHFVDKHARLLHRTISAIPPETLAALQSWSWPGNVRELENVLERAVILARDGVLRVQLGEEPRSKLRQSATVVSPTVLDVERESILTALRASAGIIAGPQGAAARLGLRRTTLQSRMQRLGIKRPGY